MIHRLSVHTMVAVVVALAVGLSTQGMARATTLRQTALLLECGTETRGWVSYVAEFQQNTVRGANYCDPGTQAKQVWAFPSATYAALGPLLSLSYVITMRHNGGIERGQCVGATSGDSFGTVSEDCRLDIPNNPYAGQGAYFYFSTTP